MSIGITYRGEPRHNALVRAHVVCKFADSFRICDDTRNLSWCLQRSYGRGYWQSLSYSQTRGSLIDRLKDAALPIPAEVEALPAIFRPGH